jgi:hypothetical protein
VRLEKLKNLMPYYEKERQMAYQCLMHLRRALHGLGEEYDLYNLAINSSLSLQESQLNRERVWLEL